MPEKLPARMIHLIAELGPNPKQNIDIIVRRGCELLKGDAAVYGRMDSGNGAVELLSSHNLPDRPAAERELAGEVCRHLIAAGGDEPFCVSGAAAMGAMPSARALAKPPFRSILGHAAGPGEGSRAALAVLHSRPRRFEAEDRLLMAFLARAAAMEESRHRREQRLSRRVGLEKMLKDMSAIALAVEDKPAFIDRCLGMLGRRMGVGGAFLWEFEPQTGAPGCSAEWRAEGRSARKPGRRSMPAAAPSGWVSRLMGGQLLKIDDVRQVRAPNERQALKALGAAAILVIPLFSRQVFFGCLGLTCHQGPKRWAHEEILILQTAAEIMMQGLENKLLTEELIADRQSLEKTVATSSLALHEVTDRLAEKTEAHRKTIAELKAREAELRDKNEALMELSQTLTAILRQREEAAGEAEEDLIRRLRGLIDPGVRKASPAGVEASQDQWVETVKGGLRTLAALLRKKSSFVYQCLTPMEVKVAERIRQGKANKEIAGELNLSPRTVEVHRYNIRKKLGIAQTGMNLETYLSTMD